jgi:hypothetical protein
VTATFHATTFLHGSYVKKPGLEFALARGGKDVRLLKNGCVSSTCLRGASRWLCACGETPRQGWKLQIAKWAGGSGHWTMGSGQWAVSRDVFVPGGSGRVRSSKYEVRSTEYEVHPDPASPHYSNCNLQFPFFNLHLKILPIFLAVIVVTGTLPRIHAEVEFPEPDHSAPVVVSAEAANRWKQGSYDVWWLRGNCRLQQGDCQAVCREAVLWIEPAVGLEKPESKIIAYLEGNVVLEKQAASPGGSPLFTAQKSGQSPGVPTPGVTDQNYLGRFYTCRDVQMHVSQVGGPPAVLPPIYQRGMEQRQPVSADTLQRTDVRGVQFTEPIPAPAPEMIGPLVPVVPPTPPPQAILPGLPPGRRVRVFPRSDVPMQWQWFPDPVGPQAVVVIDSGVNVVIEGVNLVVNKMQMQGAIDLSADRVVIWTNKNLDLTGQTPEDPDRPLEFYLEGNIVFRQGTRTIYADRMYYDARNHVGTVINAEILTRVPDYEGYLRLRTDLLQQISPNRYYAQNSFITSSRLGEPTYRLQAGDLVFQQEDIPLVDPATGLPLLDPQTQQPAVDSRRYAEGSNNLIYLGSLPVFYWPYFRSRVDEPTYYLRRISIRSDRIYGTQVLTNWNGYELLGLRNPPRGTDLDLSLDYFGKRGFGHGGSFHYFRESIFGIPGQANGLFDLWGIRDYGLDQLGGSRYNLEPEKDYRFRLFWNHRQLLGQDWQLTAEAGWISDRNFLQSWYIREWNGLKDQNTGLELKQTQENRTLSLAADVRLNNFYTQTEWLPRGDHFWLGQPLLGDTFTWYEHSSAAFARFKPGNAPTNPRDRPFQYLDWNKNAAVGERLFTTQEIDWPFQLGPVKIVPYALGQAARWGQDTNGDDLNRLSWQAGLRASLPMWSVNPAIEDELLNVHGVAHKVTFEAEFAYADSNRELALLPLYDLLNDNSIIAAQQRFIVSTFGGLIPRQFDERFYAVRTGLGSWVSSPSPEIFDDLMVLRLGAEQRWQTKRGLPGNQHILDWITLNTHISLFPEPDRDDFGQVPGLADYDFRWHVGDRLTFVSDGIFDFFHEGQKTFSAGGFLTRPPRGSLYLGYRYIDGPVQNRILSTSFSYWMSPKWVSTFGTTIDLGHQGNLGQFASITRIGESFLINVGFSVDPIHNNWGAMFNLEPRFLAKSRLRHLPGITIPPTGEYGLE